MVYFNWEIIKTGKPNICKCLVCGRIKEVKNIHNIKKGLSKSCGCKRPHKSKGYLRNHCLYGTWYQMIDRCNNTSNKFYKYYGGRGITVCDEWQNDFFKFVNDVGLRPTEFHTIDRIDNNKGYFKENIRWATKKEQRLNTRPRIDQVFVNVFGSNFTIRQLSQMTGWNVSKIKNYVYRNKVEKLKDLIIEHLKQNTCHKHF